MTTIYITNINDNISKEKYNELYNNISPERKEKVQRLKFEADKKRSIYAESLLRYALAEQFNLTGEIEFEYNQYGKSSIKGREDIKYNLSHSGDYVVCAVSNKEIGVDVEEIKHMRLSVAKRFFHEKEYVYLEQHSGVEQEVLFFILWTLKESYVKYLGVGLTKEINTFYFEVDDKELTNVVRDSNFKKLIEARLLNASEASSLHCYSMILDGSYALSCITPENNIDVQQVNF